jgi:elongation factor Ts
MSQISAAQVKDLRERTGAGMMDCKSALTEANGDVEEAVKVLRKKGLAAASKKAGRIASEGIVEALVEGSKGVLIEVNSETDFVAKTDDFKGLVEGLATLIASSGVDSVEALNASAWPGDTEGRNVQQIVAEKIGKIGENISVRRFVRYETPAGAALGSYVHGGGRIGVLVEVLSEGGDQARAAELARDVAMHVAAAEPRFLGRQEVTEADLATEREIARDQAIKSGKPENIAEKIVAGKMEKFYGEACLLEQPYIRDDKSTVSQHLARQGKEHGCTYRVTRFTRYKLGEGMEKKADDFVAEVLSYQK